jgi:hypothetical protein
MTRSNRAQAFGFSPAIIAIHNDGDVAWNYSRTIISH